MPPINDDCDIFQVILGCVDEFSNIFVFSVSEDPSDSSLSHELLLEVSADGKDVTDSDYQRFIWCPYLPEDGSEEDEDEPDCPARQFVVTCGPVAEIWNLDMVTSQFGDRISRAQTKKVRGPSILIRLKDTDKDILSGLPNHEMAVIHPV